MLHIFVTMPHIFNTMQEQKRTKITTTKKDKIAKGQKDNRKQETESRTKQQKDKSSNGQQISKISLKCCVAS